MKEKFNIAGYVRISVDDELDRDNVSIENQKAIIADYVRFNFPGSDLTFFEDRDRSGYTFEQRESYQEMRRGLLSHKYDILIVKDFSRFSRRTSQGLMELENFRDEGVRIISIGDTVDFPNNNDWFKISIHFIMNEMPVTETSRKVKNVIERRQNDGEWICAAPYGYIINTHKKFEIVPTEAEIVRKIFDLYINEGMGYNSIANYLTDSGVPTPRMSEQMRKEAEGKEYKRQVKAAWAIETIHGILQNDFYIGTLRQSKYTRVKINGKSKKLDDGDHIVHEKHHQAIIDYHTFALARAAMESRSRNNYRGVKINDNIYSGLLKCGDCGSPMFAINKKGCKPAYNCGTYHRRGPKECPSHLIKAETLDNLIRLYVEKIMQNSASMIDQLNADLECENENIEETEQTAENIAKVLVDLNEELKVTKRMRIREIMKNPDREADIEDMYDELESDLQRKIDGLNHQLDLLSDKRNTIIRVNRVAKTAIDIFSDILTKEKLERNDLELIIESVYVYGDHVEIKLQRDIDMIIRCGVLPEETEKAANFNSGTVDILSAELVQVSRNHSDKVYSVNVISDGDPLEIYTDADGEVIFKKYSPIGELSSITGQYADVLARGTGLAVIVTDRDSVISCAGISKKEILDRRVSRSLESLMERRENYVCCVDSERIKPVEGVDKEAAVAFPIVGGGDVSGAIVMLLNENGSCPTQTETKLAQVAANFLGKQMEE